MSSKKKLVLYCIHISCQYLPDSMIVWNCRLTSFYLFCRINMATELLISLVRERPVLWDKSHEDYKSRACTTHSWREVCNKLNQDFEGLSDRGKNSYGKYLIMFCIFFFYGVIYFALTVKHLQSYINECHKKIFICFGYFWIDFINWARNLEKKDIVAVFNMLIVRTNLRFLAAFRKNEITPIHFSLLITEVLSHEIIFLQFVIVLSIVQLQY